MFFQKKPKTVSWYVDEVVSHKRLIFALFYYFIIFINIGPNLTYFVLSIFMNSDTAFLYAQLLSDMICMFPIIYLMMPLLKDSWNSFVSDPSYTFWYGIRLYLPQIFTSGIFQTILMMFTGISNGANQDTANYLFEASPLSIIIPAVFIAPIIEELIFRGIIFRGTRKFGFIPAALASGFTFGLLHCMGDILSGNFLAASFIVIYMVMGMFMCKAYEDSENIYGSISLHFFTNLIAVIAMTFL